MPETTRFLGAPKLQGDKLALARCFDSRIGTILGSRFCTGGEAPGTCSVACPGCFGPLRARQWPADLTGQPTFGPDRPPLTRFDGCTLR